MFEGSIIQFANLFTERNDAPDYAAVEPRNLTAGSALHSGLPNNYGVLMALQAARCHKVQVAAGCAGGAEIY